VFDRRVMEQARSKGRLEGTRFRCSPGDGNLTSHNGSDYRVKGIETTVVAAHPPSHNYAGASYKERTHQQGALPTARSSGDSLSIHSFKTRVGNRWPPPELADPLAGRRSPANLRARYEWPWATTSLYADRVQHQGDSLSSTDV